MFFCYQCKKCYANDARGTPGMMTVIARNKIISANMLIVITIQKRHQLLPTRYVMGDV